MIERPDNACPAEVDRFEPVDDTWEVVWRKPGGDCEDVGLGWVYLRRDRAQRPRRHHDVRAARRATGLPVVGGAPGRESGAHRPRARGIDSDDRSVGPAGSEQAALDAATTLVLEAQSSAEPGTAAGAATALQYEAMWSRFLDPPEAPSDRLHDRRRDRVHDDGRRVHRRVPWTDGVAHRCGIHAPGAPLPRARRTDLHRRRLSALLRARGRPRRAARRVRVLRAADVRAEHAERRGHDHRSLCTRHVIHDADAGARSSVGGTHHRSHHPTRRSTRSPRASAIPRCTSRSTSRSSP